MFKLHAKNLLAEKKFGNNGCYWRDILVGALLASEASFCENLKVLQNNSFGRIAYFETKCDMDRNLNIPENS